MFLDKAREAATLPVELGYKSDKTKPIFSTCTFPRTSIYIEVTKRSYYQVLWWSPPCMASFPLPLTYVRYCDSQAYGQTECTPCPVGTFGRSSGANTCEVCPEGTYQDQVWTYDSMIRPPTSGLLPI